MKHISHSAEETKKIAAEFSKNLKSGTIIGLMGDLGAGKTTFVQGLAEGLGISKEYTVNSPTFTLLNEYHGSMSLYHFDLYRLGTVQDIERQLKDLGFEEYWEGEGICVVEWAEKLPEREKKKMIPVVFKYQDENSRSIEIPF